MNEKMKGIIIGMLLTVSVIGTTVLAAGESVKKNVDIFFKNIKICVDGSYIEPKDGDGNAVEPFILDGTTYLPVRAVANAFGKDVNWDGNTNTVFLGAKPGENKYNRTNPAPIGNVQNINVVNYTESYSAAVVIKEVVRGQKAYEMLKRANTFNDEPAEGKEYVLVKVAVAVSNVKGDSAVSLNEFDFEFYRTDYSEYDDLTFVVTPSPEFGGDVYDGGTVEGYLCKEIDITDATPTMVFGNDYHGKGGIWFSLTK